MIKEKKILITGINGFIGNHLKNFFKKKNKIFSQKKILKFSTKAKKKSVSPDIIFHCAGPSSVSKSIINPKKDYKENFILTKNLLDNFKHKKIKPVIYIFSSAAVYGNKKSSLKAISPYGKNKLKVENLCKKYAKKYNFKFIIMRLFSVYGTGLKKQFFWDICEKLRKKNYTFFGTGNEKRSWLHISDLISAINKIKLNKNNYIILDIGSLEPQTNKFIVNLFFKINKEKTEPTFNNIFRKGDPVNLISNNIKIIRFGWKPKININKGIIEYLNWYKKNHLKIK